ncbi:hypothetical protein SAMN04487983_1014129 [Streptomyces sp. yr375]|uniref:DUF6230 family protein n=1 Tax=Streptomyces sp. yr375 TaxID=1761906 RepID=UPI0008B12CA6|nr:DUF6230 family protein [Streptomyces sp. yr375]SER32281.1 hypothetical protein SAMN04487983_1014129 [Streptomyces sp. yr375]
MESQVRGGTRWKRFAVVMVPSVAATACIGVALAQGALAASFSVSGQSFKVSADYIHGEGFSQYGAIDTGKTLDNKGAIHPVAVSAFADARIQKMCQSVVTPGIPLLGSVTLQLTAGDSSDQQKQVRAQNLYIDVEDLAAEKAVFNDMEIGVSAGSMKNPPMKDKDQASPNGFGQQASSVDLYGVKQTAWATTAGTFTLPGLSMKLYSGTKECY